MRATLPRRWIGVPLAYNVAGIHEQWNVYLRASFECGELGASLGCVAALVRRRFLYLKFNLDGDADTDDLVAEFVRGDFRVRF